MNSSRTEQLAFDLEPTTRQSHLTLAELQTVLDEWMAAGWLRSVDRAVAGLVARHAPDVPPLALLGVVLASHQAGQGHVCLDLAACLHDAKAVLRMPSHDGRLNDQQNGLAPMPRMTPAALLHGVTLADWQAALAACPDVIQHGGKSADPEQSNPPFIVEAGQVYLRRYWQQEESIVGALRTRLAPQNLPTEPVRKILDALFPPSVALGASARIDSTSAGSPRVQMQGATRREWPSPFASGATQQLGPWRPALTGLAGLSALGVTAARHAMSMASSRCLDCEPLLSTWASARGAIDSCRAPLPDWQKIACALAIRQRFALIAGGPGTGKTTTVVKFLMLLQMQAQESGLPPRRIRLCAPTGKAAARLRQSILGQMDGLLAPYVDAYPNLRQDLPSAVETVHRLIGVRPNQPHPIHQPQNPLPADVVVVDEASMIGVELMAKLLAALDETTQLVLLGDKDQLASVEPGAVLGELASVVAPDAYSPATRGWLAATTGAVLPVSETTRSKRVADTAVAQVAVQLQHSYRFDSASEIGALARSVNAGDAGGALTLLSAYTEQASVRLVADDAGHQPLRRIVRESLAPWLAALKEPLSAEHQDDRALAIFAAHNKAQVLCALRHGPYGVTGLNRWIEDMLRRSGALAVTGEWYVGRPVMVTRNDHALRLANGEIGITLPYVDPQSPQSPPSLRVAFLNEIIEKGESPIRWIAPGRLTACETAFALTVHKAQGSEFDHSVLVLPAKPNPVLTRELIYTAITRARHRFTLVTAATDTAFTVLKQGIASRVQRSGQLGLKLARLDD